MSKEKTYKIGDIIKLTNDSWSFDEYDTKGSFNPGDKVYTVEIKKIEKNPEPVIKKADPIQDKKDAKPAISLGDWPTSVEIKKKPFRDIFSILADKKKE